MQPQQDFRPYYARRIGATIFDYTLIWAVTIGFVVVFGQRDEKGVYHMNGLPVFVPFIAWFLYFPIGEGWFHGTLGHKLFGLKVVSLEEGPMTFGQGCKRRLCDIVEISWCLGLVAFVIALTNRSGRRLGDFWANTVVVAKNESIKSFEFDFDH